MSYYLIGFLIIIVLIELVRGDFARIFFPDECIDSTYDIDFSRLAEEGKKGVIFDIDNTLVEHGFPADNRSIKLLHDISELGLKVVFLSNNKEPRVKSFKDAALPDADYIYKAGKPSKSGYLKACKMMEITTEEAIFVGDQLFTDVWGAKRSGISNILVSPIDKHEEIQIIIKRRLEYIVLAYYKRSKLYKKDLHKRV